MCKGSALGDREQAVAAFVASELGCEATRVVRVDAFATNAVYDARHASTQPRESLDCSIHSGAFLHGIGVAKKDGVKASVHIHSNIHGELR